MASGDTLLPISNVHGYEPPASDYATTGRRNGHNVLEFNTDADKQADFKLIMPRHYGGGGVNIYPHFSMAAATSGDVVLQVQFERLQDGAQDVDSDGFAAGQSATIAVPGTAGNVESSNSISFTNGAQMDSVVAGDLFRLRVTRQESLAGDTAGDVLQLHAIEVREA